VSAGARSIILDQAFASKDRPACLPFLHVGTRGAAAERPAESAARAANIPIARLGGVLHNRSEIDRTSGYGPNAKPYDVRLMVSTRGKADLTRTSPKGPSLPPEPTYIPISNV
jgi:hypothetical protein